MTKKAQKLSNNVNDKNQHNVQLQTVKKNAEHDLTVLLQGNKKHPLFSFMKWSLIHIRNPFPRTFTYSHPKYKRYRLTMFLRHPKAFQKNSISGVNRFTGQIAFSTKIQKYSDDTIKYYLIWCLIRNACKNDADADYKTFQICLKLKYDIKNILWETAYTLVKKKDALQIDRIMTMLISIKNLFGFPEIIYANVKKSSLKKTKNPKK